MHSKSNVEIAEGCSRERVCLLLNSSLCAWCTVRPNKLTHWNLRQRKVYCKGQARSMGGSCSKHPNSPIVFWEEFLKTNSGGGLQDAWLVGGEVTGWWSRNLSHQPSGSNWSGVNVLMLSLKLPPSTWVRALVPVKELKEKYQIVVYILWGGTSILLYHCTVYSSLLFLCFCIPSPPN